MELELMKRSNLYKEMKEGIDIETEKEIASNFFNFFRQVCVDEEKDFDETISLVSNIVILLEVDKFLENFWTIKIVDFYCFDTNDTLVRMVNLAEREERTYLEHLDKTYTELALFQKILYYTSPSFRPLNDELKLIHIKWQDILGRSDILIRKYYTVVDDNLMSIQFEYNEGYNRVEINSIQYCDNYCDTICGALYAVYEEYILEKDETFAENFFRDLAIIYNYNAYINIPIVIASIF